VRAAIGRREERAAVRRIDGGLVNDAEHRLTGAEQADHDREALAAADEVLGAVDRVDEPQPPGVR
jgi:hypothetical protein